VDDAKHGGWPSISRLCNPTRCSEGGITAGGFRLLVVPNPQGGNLSTGGEHGKAESSIESRRGFWRRASARNRRASQPRFTEAWGQVIGQAIEQVIDAKRHWRRTDDKARRASLSFPAKPK